MSRFELDRLATHLVTGEITWSLHYEAACDSTQDLARTAAVEGAAEGWTLITDLQREGRGRQGRSWLAPTGEALLVSVVLRPPIDVVPKLPLLIGLAVAGGIEVVTGAAPDLKWPNDVLLGDKKLAGILLERPPDSAVVAGMGVNVNQAATDLPAGATSLAVELGRTVDREVLLAGILNDLGNAYERADREGVQWIVPAWRSRSSMLGRPIRFTRARGEASQPGRPAREVPRPEGTGEAVRRAVVDDVAVLVRALGIVMGEMDQATLPIPDVLAVDHDAIALFDRHPLANRDVVFHLDRQVLRGQPDDELLVPAGAAASVREGSDDDAVGGDFDLRPLILKIGSDGRIIGRHRRRRGASRSAAPDQQQARAPGQKAREHRMLTSGPSG